MKNRKPEMMKKGDECKVVEILVSYIDEATNSVCAQARYEISQFRNFEMFNDLKNGHEIECLISEMSESLCFLQIPEQKTAVDVYAIRLRIAADTHNPNSIPFGAELFQMIHHKKGCSAFSMTDIDDEALMLGEQNFSKFIENGKIVREDFGTEDREIGKIRYVVFYLQSEVWRFRTYYHLKKHMEIAPWSKHLNQIESFILGYEYPSD